MFVRRARSWLAWFGVLNVLWLVLISAFDTAETVLGIFASALGATAAQAVLEQRLVAFRPRARWWLAAGRLPARTVVETGLVFGALWRRLRGERVEGRFRAVPFPVSDDPARASAARFVRTLGESIAPNRYVVGFDEETQTLLIHELVAR
jgi:hypothetical protein